MQNDEKPNKPRRALEANRRGREKDGARQAGGSVSLQGPTAKRSAAIRFPQGEACFELYTLAPQGRGLRPDVESRSKRCEVSLGPRFSPSD